MNHSNQLERQRAFRRLQSVWLLPSFTFLVAACSGGLQASGGLKLDAKTGLTTKLDAKASTSAQAGNKESSSEPRETGEALDDALAGSHRSEENRKRDAHNHPKETLVFFGLKTDMTVLEVEPGSDGWYTEIFAPVLKDHGVYVATNFDANGPEKSPLTRVAKAFQDKLASHPEVYGKVKIVTLTEAYDLGEPNSVDMVVTFRNSHLWKQDKIEDRVYGAMFKVLKPGGVLGIVQHRANAGDSASRTYTSGYLPQPYVIERVEKAGFAFEAESHVNANSWDTKDYPKGVWTLPPSYALGDKDREKYSKIGESDRMTLRFRKPEGAVTPPEETKAKDSAPTKDAAPKAGAEPAPAPKPEATPPPASPPAAAPKPPAATPPAATPPAATSPAATSPPGSAPAAPAASPKAGATKAKTPEAAKPATPAPPALKPPSGP